MLYRMLHRLHPAQMDKTERSNYIELVQTILQFYKFDNFIQDAMSWYDIPKEEFFSQTKSQEELKFVDLVKNWELFLAVRQAMITLLTLPTTTYTLERSFSAMRWVKNMA